MKIELKILDKKFYSEESNGMLLNPLPSHTTEGSAGIDLRVTEDIVLCPQEKRKIGTGLALHIGCYRGQENKWAFYNSSYISMMGMIVPRSGKGSEGLVLANTVGIIDEDYQGEIIISAWNSNAATYQTSMGTENGKSIFIKAGERIAQMIFVPVLRAEFEVVKEFSSISDRGEGGFGHTGSY